MGRVNHQRGARHGGVVGYVSDEGLHLLGAVKHGVVHVDVDDVGAALDLSGGYAQAFGVVACGYEPGELARTGHVGALAHVGEVARLEVDVRRLQSAYGKRSQPVALRLRSGQRSGGKRTYGFGNGADVLRRSAAASPGYVEQAVGGHACHGLGHFLRRFGVASETVGQSGVGMAAHGTAREGRHLLNQRAHLVGSQRAVKAEGGERIVAYRRVKGLQGLPRKGASAAVANRSRYDEGEASVGRKPAGDAFIRHENLVVKQPFKGVNGGFGVERVETCLQEKHVCAALYEPSDLFGVSLGHLVERHGARRRVVNDGRKRERLRRRPHASGHIHLPPRAAKGLVGRLTSYARALTGHVCGHAAKAVFGLRHGVCAERVGLYYVRPGGYVLLVYLPYGVGAGKVKAFVVAFQLAPVPRKRAPAEVVFAQIEALQHSAHRPVEHEYAAFGQRAGYVPSTIGMVHVMMLLVKL